MKGHEKLKKVVKENVEGDKNFTVCFHITKEGKIEMIGEKKILHYLKANQGGVTLDDLLVKMEEFHENKNDAALEFDEFSVQEFPKLKTKFQSKQWTLPVARDYLRTILQILGFGRGQLKTYKNESNKPDGWPEHIAFVTFLPNMVTKCDANEIIESLLKHRGIDVRKHHIVAQQPQVDQQQSTDLENAQPRIEIEEQQSLVDQQVPVEDERTDNENHVLAEVAVPHPFNTMDCIFFGGEIEPPASKTARLEDSLQSD